MVWLRSDRVIGRSLSLYGEFAEGENRMMSRFVRPGDVAIDVGANLGTTVLPLAKATGPSGMVLAFEPQPLIAQLLQTTLTINDCFNVRTFTAAVAERPGWSRMPAQAPGGNFGALSLGGEGLKVPVLRLDDIELPSCALIKVDVEGLEWRVLQGATGHLQQHRPVVYLEAKRIQGTKDYLHWFMESGWRCYWHFAAYFRPDNYRKFEKDVFGQKGDMNVLAVPNEAAQPDDLPQIKSPDEDWRPVYYKFFQERGIEWP
jgi:FkbM family methyltransferase